MINRYLLAVIMLFSSVARAQEDSHSIRKLSDMNIEDLMKIEVSSITKRNESIHEVPSAVFVITQEDIRRSGATSVPEILRLVPGFQVARIDANKWAISSRGFNGRFANKLLVLMDGRSVYTPLFSGVFWEIQDTLLEDIDRIEVIRGPGGTLWGANAVNGVVNIITKSSEDTHGGLITAGGGTEETFFGSTRYGGTLGDNGNYRFFAKYSKRDSQFHPSGSNDDWHAVRTGLRSDWDLSDAGQLNFIADFYYGSANQIVSIPTFSAPFVSTQNDNVDMTGGNFLLRWKYPFSDTSDATVQFYYDRLNRSELQFTGHHDTFDFDFQHRFDLPLNQNIVWGGGFRGYMDSIERTNTLSFSPSTDDLQIANFFVQDRISLLPDKLSLTFGTKLEYNSFSGLSFLPSGQIRYTPHNRHTLWASVSRAVRVPSRAQNALRLTTFQDPSTGVFPRITGNPDSGFETLLAAEIGYRSRLRENLGLDISTFFHQYDDLVSFETGTPFIEPFPQPTHGVVPLNLDNLADARTVGAEVVTNWQPIKRCKVSASYSLLIMDVDTDSASADATTENDENESPRHQVGLRTRIDLPWDIEFDLFLRYVSSLPAFSIGSYIVADARLAWRPIGPLEISLVGQNLGERRHPEFQTQFLGTRSTEVEHSVYGKVTWDF